jgi:coenzyme F420 hydrogenase subunit beta
VFPDDDETVDFDGLVRAAWIGHAADDDARRRGASGGVVTAILASMMAQGQVDACLVTRMKADQPWRAEAFIATTPDELWASQSSRYQIVPVNRLVAEILRLPGRVTAVTLPCQAHGLRMMMKKLPRLGEKIHYIVGLFCGGALESFFVPELLAANGLRHEHIGAFQFRGGDWPGQMRAILPDGATRPLHYSNYKDGLYNYVISLYMPPRCQTCLDGAAEFADISVGDAWGRDRGGHYRDPANSKVLIRTERGAALIAHALQAGAVVGDFVADRRLWATPPMQKKRKTIYAPLRLSRLRQKGIPVPTYILNNDRLWPQVGVGDIVRERGVSFLLLLGQSPLARRLILGFLTSKLAKPIIRWRSWMKKRRQSQK